MYYRIISIPIIVVSLIVLQFTASCSDNKATPPPDKNVPISYILVPGDFPTIADAIDSADEFDTIVVLDGTYTETISFHDKTITLASKYLIDGDESHIANTIIDGTPDESNSVDSGSVVMFNADSGHSSVLAGMTITGGVGVPHTVGFSGSTGRCGGGIFCIDASPTISHCIISDNTAEHGGGMFSGGSSQPTLSFCTFANNEATADQILIPIGVGGGAISLFSKLTVDNCEFRENSSASCGGAMSIGSTIDNTTLIENSRFVGNSANTGGAINTSLTSITVNDCVFDSNQAEMGGVIFSSIAHTCVYNNSEFTNNYSSENGAVFYALSPEDNLTGCLFYGNVSGGDGAAGYWSGSEHTTMRSCTFVGNSTLSGGKSALCVDGSMTLDRCIIAYNSSCKAATNAGFIIKCTDIFGNQEGDWVGTILELLVGMNNNFSLDPVFCDKPNYDYRLSDNSPCAPANSGCGELVGSEPVGCQ